jgi:hypothetical protein
VAHKRGSGFVIVAIWPRNRRFERQLKTRNTPRDCDRSTGGFMTRAS